MSNSIRSPRVPNIHSDPDCSTTRDPLRVHTRNNQQISQRPKIQAVYKLRELVQDGECHPKTNSVRQSFPRYLWYEVLLCQRKEPENRLVSTRVLEVKNRFRGIFKINLHSA